MSEIELKLSGKPARVKAAFARLASQAVPKSSFQKMLRATYFDTAKDDLRVKGLSFRVRDENGRFVQTLKQGTVGAVSLARDEWSDVVQAPAPELLKTKSGRRLRRLWSDVRLLPRFQTDIAREGFLMRPRRGAVVEVVCDLGAIHDVGGEDSIAVAEIEIELKKGPIGAIFDVAMMLLESDGLHIEPRTKSERGYAVSSAAGRLKAVKAAAPTVRGAATLAETLRDAARVHIGQFLANMPGAGQHDAACIHQMRVSMRRLRAALRGMRKQIPKAAYETVRVQLRYLQRSLGAARDWEVLTVQLARQKNSAHGAVAEVTRAAQQRKRKAVDRAVSVIGARKSTRALVEAMRWFEDLPSARAGTRLKVKTSTAAPDLLDTLFRRVLRRAQKLETQSVADLHRLRIACKNLRYNLELFSGLYPKSRVGDFLKRLKAVQDDLGRLNDASRARALLGALADRSPRKAAADAVVERLEARVKNVRARAARHVAALTAAKPFWVKTR